MGGKPNITYSGFKGFQNQGLWRTATGLGLAFDHCFAQGGDHSLDPFSLAISFNHFRLTTLPFHSAFPQTQIRSRSALWPPNAAFKRSPVAGLMNYPSETRVFCQNLQIALACLLDSKQVVFRTGRRIGNEERACLADLGKQERL
jgi:hypothetical protein